MRAIFFSRINVEPCHITHTTNTNDHCPTQYIILYNEPAAILFRMTLELHCTN